MKNKLIVIGLDGASFELIQPWIDNNELPNLKRIQKKGCYADMEVCLPPVTSPNWKCYSTGKNPGKIGAFWWENINIENRRVYHPRKYYAKQKEIWEYLGADGKRVLVMNMPTTYPPKEVNGILISGGPDAEESGFAYPREIEEWLKERNYEVHAEKLNPNVFDKQEIYESCRRAIDKRFKIFKELLKKDKFDFAQLIIFHVNALQHFYWDDESTKEVWKIIDTHLGDFVDKDQNMIILSDHGSNKIEHVFNINAWLEKEGYLVLKEKLRRGFLQKTGITKEKGYAVASKIGIKKKTLTKILPKKVQEAIPSEGGEFKKESKTSIINWEKSRAIASGQGPLYIIGNQELRDELKEKLENLKHPKSGKRMVRKIYFKEEIYSGKYVEKGPDLLLDMAKGIHIAGGVGKKDIFEGPKKWLGENKKTGLFMAFGEDIPAKGKISKVHILDLAPSILDFFGLKKPEDMDGQSIKDVM